MELVLEASASHASKLCGYRSSNLHFTLFRAQKNRLNVGLFMKVVGAGGFEPPTARFVAEYSIQLSYAPTFIDCLFKL